MSKRGAGHGLARDLHNRGVLARLVGDMMSGRKRRVRVTLRALGGVLRADFSREVPA